LKVCFPPSVTILDRAWLKNAAIEFIVVWSYWIHLINLKTLLTWYQKQSTPKPCWGDRCLLPLRQGSRDQDARRQGIWNTFSLLHWIYIFFIGTVWGCIRSAMFGVPCSNFPTNLESGAPFSNNQESTWLADFSLTRST
jgi:hypothetical protein